MQVVLPRPGPRVEPPLRVEVEHAAGWDDLEALREALEERIRGRLTIPADVELVPPGRLGRSELKTALTRIEESR
jgi:phenylacetate-CoA ligase